MTDLNVSDLSNSLNRNDAVARQEIADQQLVDQLCTSVFNGCEPLLLIINNNHETFHK
jgi:hypothetical protein